MEFLQIDEGLSQMSGRIDTYDPEGLQQVRAHPDHRAQRRVVETQRLDHILAENNIDRIDFLSVDLEGAEFDILSAIPFGSTEVDVISVENSNASPHLHGLLSQHGYQLIEFFGVDEVYCRAALLNGV